VISRGEATAVYNIYSWSLGGYVTEEEATKALNDYMLPTLVTTLPEYDKWTISSGTAKTMFGYRAYLEAEKI